MGAIPLMGMPVVAMRTMATTMLTTIRAFTRLTSDELFLVLVWKSNGISTVLIDMHTLCASHPLDIL